MSSKWCGAILVTTIPNASSAKGILAALERIKIELPIVVRLDGTNAQEGRKILAAAAPSNLHVEATMLDGARRAVELAHG